MKYIAFVLLTGWSVYALYTFGDLKPSENLIIWSLGVTTIMYSVASGIMLLIDRKNHL